jgi:PKD repeat protein
MSLHRPDERPLRRTARRRSRPARSVLELILLEDRSTPATWLAVGTALGQPPTVRLYDDSPTPHVSFNAFDPAFAGGVTVALGRLAGASPGVVVGAGPGAGPHVKVFDSSGRELRSFLAFDAAFAGGVRLATGDVDGDRIDDIIVGAGAAAGGHVKVFSGSDGRELYSFFAYDNTLTQGVYVAAADVTGDGRADVITGPGGGTSRMLKVFDGATGALVRSITAFTSAVSGGLFVAGGDLNGDGKAEVIASTATGQQVAAYNGVNGSETRNFRTGFTTGTAVAAADLTGDGRADFVTAPAAAANGTVRVYNGATGQIVREFAPGLPGTGLRVAALGAGTDIPPSPPDPPPLPPPPTAQLVTSGPVVEGGSATVSFVNLSDPAGGGLTYSFDFDGNGTFDQSGTSPAAAVPADLLDDGPFERLVRGKITDSLGRSVITTATLSVVNLAPTVSVGSFSGLAGQGITFGGTASDPSPIDAAALSYRWTFSDGTTATGLTPAKAFAEAGDYTATLTVTDPNGASASATGEVTVTEPPPPPVQSSTVVTADWITTPWDKIPNFGGHPTLVAVRSGNWSDARTWGGRAPQTGDVVSIGAGVTVTYDALSDTNLDTVAIQNGGRLQFRTDVNTRLKVSNLLVMEGGELRVGTAAHPVAANVTARIVFPDVPIDTSLDPEQYGHGLIGLGKVTMYGQTVSDGHVKLATEPKAGDTVLQLAEPVSGWRPGDTIALPDTHQLTFVDDHLHWTNYKPQWETRVIASVSADGRTITLTSPLSWNHVGARTPDGRLDFLPDVALISRNVQVRSENSLGERGHVFFTYRADVNVNYVQFAGLGRTTNDAFNNTTRDASGRVTHIGTNQQGRYAVQFAHVSGPQTPQASGAQFTFDGNSVVCLMNDFIYRWGLDINDSHYGSVRDNVVYNWAGAGIVTEAGNEVGNVFEGNYVSRIFGTGNRDNDGRDGNAYWFHGPSNLIRDNVATNIRGAGPYAYGFNISPVSLGALGVVQIPLFAGADMSRPDQRRSIDINAQPLAEFSGNEVYGATQNGLALWWIGSYYTDSRGTAGLVKDFVGWHLNGWGYFGYETTGLVIDGFTIRGQTQGISPENRGGSGMTFSDYAQHDLTVRHADIQGMRRGIEAPVYAFGTTTIEDSYFNNQTNIGVSTMWSVHGGAGLPPKKLVIDNVRFGVLPGVTSVDIAMWYSATAGRNMIQLDQVFVYDYNGTPGDDFQVYYTQQAASFVVPVSGTDPNNPSGRPIVGAPVAGLTNAQAWSQYHLAIAGEVAPTTQTRARISGLVRAM